MTEPYPYVDDSSTTAAEDRYLSASPVPYTTADPDDLVACYIGSITSAKYTAAGTLSITVDVPFDIIGDPTELMRSQGRMLVWEARKLMP